MGLDKEGHKAIKEIRRKVQNKYFSDKTVVSMSETDKDKDIKAKENLKEGETYTDRNNTEWKREDGSLVQVGESRLNLANPMFCPKCKGMMGGTESRLNSTFYRIAGHCYSCQLKFERKLKDEGRWLEYEENRLKENFKAWIKDVEAEYKEWKEEQMTTKSHTDYDKYGTQLNTDTWEGRSADDPMFKEIEDSIKEVKEKHNIDD